MKKLLAALLTAILIFGLTACGSRSSYQDVCEWDELYLSSMLPEPHSTRVELYTDSEDLLWVEVPKTTTAQYNSYIDLCKGMDFTIESEKNSISYTAFNADGYKLQVSHYGNGNELSIRLEAPKELGTLRWPNSDIAQLLPVPDSDTGRTEWEHSYGFVIYVGDTSLDDFNAYVDACIENGFTVDYSRGDHNYYADNSDGYHVSLNYEGNNIMSVHIEEPEDVPDASETPADKTPEPSETDRPDEESTPRPSETPVDKTPKPSETNEANNTTISTNGISPEFKEAMDSYEKFFDEYVTFMKKYTESGYSFDMLSDYMEFLDKYTETMEALEAWDDKEMSTQETTYYLEVINRINQKLLNSLS